MMMIIMIMMMMVRAFLIVGDQWSAGAAVTVEINDLLLGSPPADDRDNSFFSEQLRAVRGKPTRWENPREMALPNTFTPSVGCGGLCRAHTSLVQLDGTSTSFTLCFLTLVGMMIHGS